MTACSARASEIGETLPGTAPRNRSWVVLEHAGAFGRVALLDSGLPETLGRYLEDARTASSTGVLLAPIYAIHPAMGQEIITPAFVVVVIGGLGSFWGVVLAALIVGLVKGVTIALGYAQASIAVIYLMMLLVLLFRPRGLLGERIQRFE